MKLILAVCAVVLAGCAGVSDVVPTGAGTYIVASQGVIGNGSGAAQKVAAFSAADSFCKTRGGGLDVIRSDQVEPMFGRAPSGQVEFRCASDKK